MGGKSDEQVIEEWQELVNMSPSELKDWLETDESKSAGWSKESQTKVDEEGAEGTESVGHESGRKIIDILERNPDGNPDEYTEEDLGHMRKVVAYIKRHSAQESHIKDENSKSVRSLRNWGRNPLKEE
ncbi:DUF3140 domain-containing protein [Sporobolomyces salmoneus]|uniref:DUF3140 domain-containing protein n=1 Tax=Sporobolomyces salmoneus TaxID=183962 RepID=UPI00317A2A22